VPGEQPGYVIRCFARISAQSAQRQQAVEQAGFLEVHLYSWVLLQVEIAYFG